MLDRLKSSLVHSFAGAIAIGCLVAQGISHLAAAVGWPLRDWIHQNATWAHTVINANVFVAGRPGASSLFLQSALPLLLEALVELVAAIVLLWWLYFPGAPEAAEPL